MGRLIDADAALACFHEWVDQYGDVHMPDEMTEYRRIEELPTVDAIPIQWLEDFAKWYEGTGSVACIVVANAVRIAVKRWREDMRKDGDGNETD